MKLAYALKADTGRRDRLTPGKAMPKLDTYQRRLTELETWLTANRPALAAFARGAGCRLPDAACVLRLMVSNSRNAECDLTAGQLAAKSLLSDATVKRCLKALADAGCYVQVMPGRSAGCNGGIGRGAVRRLTMLGVDLHVPQDELVRRVVHCLTLTMLGVELHAPHADPEPAPDPSPDLHPLQRMAVHFSLNGGAPECTPLRVSSPENTPADVSHSVEPVPAEGGGGGNEEQEEQNSSSTPTLATVVPLLHRRPAPTAPDRRAFPSLAEWCAAMEAHARATAEQAGPMIEPAPAPARCNGMEGPSTQHPMPADVLLQHIAGAAGRRYAELEHSEGRAHSPRGLAAWATAQHLETLQALCRTYDHWRRWVLYAQVDTLAQALRYWHADRTLHMAMVHLLNDETNAQQQRHAGTG